MSQRRSRRKNKRQTRRKRRIFQRGGQHTNELGCKYINTKGIIFSCDAYPTRHNDRIRSLEGIDFSKLQNGAVVYVHASAIRELRDRLPSIPIQFKLVSGDMDESIPSDIFKTNEEFESFINSDKIIHWFAQNCDTTHPKLTQIPIGIDYHTFASKQTPVEQEAELERIKAAAKPTWERKPMAYSNFLQTSKANEAKFYYDREDAIKSIQPSAIYHEPARVDRPTTWSHQSEYAFVASPLGNGLDCHRTWEALALGCIPVVKKSPLDPLYTDLPVLIVNSWSDVTPELLQSTLTEFKTKQFNYDKITLKYWVDMIRSKI